MGTWAIGMPFITSRLAWDWQSSYQDLSIASWTDLGEPAQSCPAPGLAETSFVPGAGPTRVESPKPQQVKLNRSLANPKSAPPRSAKETLGRLPPNRPRFPTSGATETLSENATIPHESGKFGEL